jgi:cell division protein FtsX
VESTNHPSAEEKLRLLFEKDVDDAHKKGFWVCRLWQLLLTLNVTIVLTTIVLILLLLFIIGPLCKLNSMSR